MPTPTAIPRKTALGREEQRARAGGLGQRHRTILFLVDGQRSVAEVMHLAAQAGASVQHFDDLLSLGYVALEGAEPAAPAGGQRQDPSAPAPQVVSAPSPRRTSQRAPRGASAPELPGAPAPARLVAEGLDVESRASHAASRPSADAQAEPADPASPAEAAAAQPAPPLLDEVAVPRVSAAPLLPVRRPAGVSRPAALAPVANDDPGILNEARAHLLEALRIDPPPFVSRLASRVRGAEGASALIDLVLQIQREIGRQRRSPVGLHHVEQARELLGLGNTVVADDSGWHGWPDTL